MYFCANSGKISIKYPKKQISTIFHNQSISPSGRTSLQTVQIPWQQLMSLGGTQVMSTPSATNPQNLVASHHHQQNATILPANLMPNLESVSQMQQMDPQAATITGKFWFINIVKICNLYGFIETISDHAVHNQPIIPQQNRSNTEPTTSNRIPLIQMPTLLPKPKNMQPVSEPVATKDKPVDNNTNMAAYTLTHEPQQQQQQFSIINMSGKGAQQHGMPIILNATHATSAQLVQPIMFNAGGQHGWAHCQFIPAQQLQPTQVSRGNFSKSL